MATVQGGAAVQSNSATMSRRRATVQGGAAVLSPPPPPPAAAKPTPCAHQGLHLQLLPSIPVARKNWFSLVSVGKIPPALGPARPYTTEANVFGLTAGNLGFGIPNAAPRAME